MTTAKSLFRQALFVASGQDERVQTMRWMNNKKPASRKEIIERVDLIEMALCEPNDELTKAAVEAAANLAGYSREAGEIVFKIAKDGVVSPDPVVRREIHGRLAEFLSCYPKGATAGLLCDVTQDAVVNGTPSALCAMTEILSRKTDLAPTALDEVFKHDQPRFWEDEDYFLQALTVLAPFCGKEDLDKIFARAVCAREQKAGSLSVTLKAQALMGCLCAVDPSFAARAMPYALRDMGASCEMTSREGLLTALAIVRHGDAQERAAVTEVMERALSPSPDAINPRTFSNMALSALFEDVPFNKDEPVFARCVDAATEALTLRKEGDILRYKAASFLRVVSGTAPEKATPSAVMALIEAANEPVGHLQAMARKCLDNLMVHAPEKFDRPAIDFLYCKMFASRDYGKGTYARQVLVRLRASKDGKLIL